MKKYQVTATVETMRKVYNIEYDEVYLPDVLSVEGIENIITGMLYKHIETKHKQKIFIKIIKLDIKEIKE